MISEETTLASILRRAGKRVTQQRLLVLRAMRQSDGHLDADQIYQVARREAPSLSLSTVYRTINVLKEAGLIEELRLGEEHYHYELRAEGDHHHLVCRSCGKVIEFDCPFSDELLSCLGDEHGFEITDVRLSLMGTCAECRRSEES